MLPRYGLMEFKYESNYFSSKRIALSATVFSITFTTFSMLNLVRASKCFLASKTNLNMPPNSYLLIGGEYTIRDVMSVLLLIVKRTSIDYRWVLNLSKHSLGI